MSTPQRYAAFALLLGASWLSAAGCGADSAPAGPGPTGTGGTSNGGAGGKSGGPTVVDPGGASAGETDGQLNPLCGMFVPAMCMPDNASACSGYEPPSAAGAGAGGAATGGAGGEAGGSGIGGEPAGAGAPSGGAEAGGAEAGGAPSSGGAPPTAGVPSVGGDTAGGGGQAGEGPEPRPLPAYGCQVSRQNNQPYRSCAPAGLGVANAPCFSAVDCAPGLACVTEGEAGRCLPYCCDPRTACEAGTYCADRPLRKSPSDNVEAESPRVPVCVPADGCSLEDRYPCPSGSSCRCQGNTACMVVRDDGTTSCLEPGLGKQGEACPCAWNHVCSQVSNQCVKICRTDAKDDECGEQKCQASSELPDKFGVCVGPLD